MEKRKPTYDLTTIKTEMSDWTKLNMSVTARRSAVALNISLENVSQIVQGLTRAMFHKSMTAHADSKLWQDVYYVPHAELTLYVKFTMDSQGHLLISFKEKDSE